MKKAVILDRAKRKTAKGLPLTEEETQALLEHDERRAYMRGYMRIYRNPLKINTMKIDRNTPLVMLTLGDLLDAIKGQVSNTQTVKNETTISGKRYAHGLKGIQELFNVSHTTAQKYKDGIIKDAVFQSGRKIVVDVDKALELFNAWNEKNR